MAAEVAEEALAQPVPEAPAAATEAPLRRLARAELRISAAVEAAAERETPHMVATEARELLTLHGPFRLPLRPL